MLSGDITDFGGAVQARDILEELRVYNRTILAVPGNCDRPHVNQYLQSEGCSLHCRRVDIDGISFVGLCRWLEGEIPPGQERAGKPPASAHEVAGAHLAQAKRAVLVTHQPAHGTAVDLSLILQGYSRRERTRRETVFSHCVKLACEPGHQSGNRFPFPPRI